MTFTTHLDLAALHCKKLPCRIARYVLEQTPLAKVPVPCRQHAKQHRNESSDDSVAHSAIHVPTLPDVTEAPQSRHVSVPRQGCGDKVVEGFQTRLTETYTTATSLQSQPFSVAERCVNERKLDLL